MNVKAIETEYRGFRFRSRLEARWAVFFDSLGINWKYEPQGFVIAMYDEERPYLPDFFLPDLDVWVEVKGDPKRINWSLLGVAVDNWSTKRLPDSRRAESGGSSGVGSAIIVLGDIPPEGSHWTHWLVRNRKGVRIEEVQFTPDGDIEVGEDVGYFDASWAGFDENVDWDRQVTVHGELAFCCCMRGLRSASDRCPRTDSVKEAYSAARQAQFEHGKSTETSDRARRLAAIAQFGLL